MLRHSRLDLVDLAGSERVAVSGAAGARMEESVAINLSNLCLSNVVAALASRARVCAPSRMCDWGVHLCVLCLPMFGRASCMTVSAVDCVPGLRMCMCAWVCVLGVCLCDCLYLPVSRTRLHR